MSDIVPDGVVKSGVAVVLIIALAGIGILWSWNRAHRQLADARSDAEAAKLALAKQIVETQETRRQLQASVDGLLSENTALKAAYDSARAAAPDARPVSTARLDTGPIQVTQEITKEPEGERPPVPPDCPPPGLLHPDGMGSFFCKLPEDAKAPESAQCALRFGDLVSVGVQQIELRTANGVGILTGVANLIREKPLPKLKLAEGSFQSTLSDTTEAKPPSEPRWGAELTGRCASGGCGLGAGVLFPPLRVFGLRLEARASADFAPAPGVAAGLGVRW